ncbi:hypothetical protein A7A32_16560 [Acinetobacter baumannii]|nr:hypothetical protein A7A32_16560 [Acinetobacter baumannii]
MDKKNTNFFPFNFDGFRLIFAIENVCPHAYALLTEGFIEDQTVECPLHEAIFDIQTGELKSGPGCRNLCTYPVRVEGQDIQIQL